MSTAPSSVDMLKRLVAFDTTSRNSNLELIHYIRDYLDEFGVASTLVAAQVWRAGVRRCDVQHHVRHRLQQLRRTDLERVRDADQLRCEQLRQLRRGMHQ